MTPEQKAEGGERLVSAIEGCRENCLDPKQADIAVEEARDVLAALQAAREEIRRKDEALEATTGILEQAIAEFSGRGESGYREMFVSELRQRVGDFLDAAKPAVKKARALITQEPNDA